MAGALPVAFGSNSFAVRGDTYGNAASAVLAAGVNPMNKKSWSTVDQL